MTLCVYRITIWRVGARGATRVLRAGPHVGDVVVGGGEALDAAVGRAPGVLCELAAARARLRRDVAAALAEHRCLADELAALAPS